MKIIIKSIKGNKVEFESPYGSAIGIWKDEILAEKREYNVELDITDLIKYDDIMLSSKNEPRLELDPKGILISGLLVEYDTDGCATLKLGDSLVEVETIFNDAFISICGCYMFFVVSNIYLYDEHLF